MYPKFIGRDFLKCLSGDIAIRFQVPFGLPPSRRVIFQNVAPVLSILMLALSLKVCDLLPTSSKIKLSLAESLGIVHIP